MEPCPSTRLLNLFSSTAPFLSHPPVIVLAPLRARGKLRIRRRHRFHAQKNPRYHWLLRPRRRRRSCRSPSSSLVSPRAREYCSRGGTAVGVKDRRQRQRKSQRGIIRGRRDEKRRFGAWGLRLLQISGSAPQDFGMFFLLSLALAEAAVGFWEFMWYGLCSEFPTRRWSFCIAISVHRCIFLRFAGGLLVAVNGWSNNASSEGDICLNKSKMEFQIA